MLTQEEIQNQHCGVIAATYDETVAEMPILHRLLQTFPARKRQYLFDVKVHMLMPGQWPCIPGWHQDHVPRDENKNLQPEKISDGVPPMYLLVSGHPMTEFKGDKKIEPWGWTEFTQRDEHRGTQSQKHTWRLFVRATPKEIVPEHAKKLGPRRRHSQVYLDKDFDW